MNELINNIAALHQQQKAAIQKGMDALKEASILNDKLRAEIVAADKQIAIQEAHDAFAEAGKSVIEIANAAAEREEQLLPKWWVPVSKLDPHNLPKGFYIGIEEVGSDPRVGELVQDVTVERDGSKTYGVTLACDEGDSAIWPTYITRVMECFQPSENTEQLCAHSYEDRGTGVSVHLVCRKCNHEKND